MSTNPYPGKTSPYKQNPAKKKKGKQTQKSLEEIGNHLRITIESLNIFFLEYHHNLTIPAAKHETHTQVQRERLKP